LKAADIKLFVAFCFFYRKMKFWAIKSFLLEKIFKIAIKKQERIVYPIESIKK